MSFLYLFRIFFNGIITVSTYLYLVFGMFEIKIPSDFFLGWFTLIQYFFANGYRHQI